MTAQAATPAVDDVLWLFGAIFVGIAFLIGLARPPFGSRGGAAA